ncbi:hypothetical protein PPACK8108_LOCUS4528 [Phakopsora pachyrhizi]|uniref:Uncharacterized protein n=1 Tax=Phakopsora pachyrhizi TaxID=170000 RepID=A0AAV0AML9_PHAPC|nr:hypothetical protein PPACK8108_LOCUS4528 [Phakopsora pachyrhizi]
MPTDGLSGLLIGHDWFCSDEFSSSPSANILASHQLSDTGTLVQDELSISEEFLNFKNVILEQSFHGKKVSSSKIAGPNAPLFSTCSDPASKFSALQAVKHWISTGDSKKTSHLFQSTTGVPPKAGKTANVGGDKDACGNVNPPGGQWLFKELSGTKKLTSNAKKGLGGFERHYNSCTQTNVAVIGIGPLGYDIVKDLAISKEFAKDDNQRQAKKLYSVESHPSKLGWDFRDPKAPSWTNLIEVIPRFDRIEDNKVYLTDGRVIDNINVLYFSTGYLYSLTFCNQEDKPWRDHPIIKNLNFDQSGSDNSNFAGGYRVHNLDKDQIFYYPNPSFGLLVLNSQVVPFPLADYQARAIAARWSGPKEFDVENGLLNKIGEGGEKTEAKAPKKKGKEVGLKLIERIKYKQTGKDKDFYPTTLTSFEPEAVDGIVPPSGPGTQSTISPSDFRTKTSILTSLIKLKPLIKVYHDCNKHCQSQYIEELYSYCFIICCFD